MVGARSTGELFRSEEGIIEPMTTTFGKGAAKIPSPSPPVDERLRPLPGWQRILARPELGSLTGVILVFLFFGTVAGNSGMFSMLGVFNFLGIAAQLGILAVAAALLMIAGEFDLSIGSMIAFSGMTLALVVTQLHWPIYAGILVAFVGAAVFGVLNGVLVTRTRMPSFIVTLASLFVLRGLTLALTRLIVGRTQVPGVSKTIGNDWLAPFFHGTVFQGTFRWLAAHQWIATDKLGNPLASGVPIAIVWWIGLTAVASWVLLRTRFGNWIFATGGDEVAARNVAVPVTAVKVTLFAMMALAAALFGIIQVLDNGSADTLRGLEKEFEAVIAVVVGGTLLTGGYGSAIGSAFGALIFGTVQMGIFYTGVDTDWFKVFMGVMVLIAVMVNDTVRRRVVQAR